MNILVPKSHSKDFPDKVDLINYHLQGSKGSLINFVVVVLF